MNKIQYAPDDPLAPYYAMTKVIGVFFTQETLLGEFFINSDTGAIDLKIRWKYNWLKDGSVKEDWTLTEKSKFIANVHITICEEWNGKIFYSVSGDSDFAKKFQGKKLPLNIVIVPVSHDAHWDVTVTKVEPDIDNLTYVRWKDKTIQLDSNDVVATTRCTGEFQAICHTRSSVIHEVGHILGYFNDEYVHPQPKNFQSRYLSLSDMQEVQIYNANAATNIYGWDTEGLMSAGSELRARYLEIIPAELNVIIPDTYFSLVRAER